MRKERQRQRKGERQTDETERQTQMRKETDTKRQRQRRDKGRETETDETERQRQMERDERKTQREGERKNCGCPYLCVAVCTYVSRYMLWVRAQTRAPVLTFSPCLGQVSLLMHKPGWLTLEVLKTTQTHGITGVQYCTQLLHRFWEGRVKCVRQTAYLGFDLPVAGTF